MKVGERGQVTIPKAIRDKFGIQAATEVEFAVEDNHIVLRKTGPVPDFSRWVGRLAKAFGDESVDEAIEVLRGR